MDLPTYADVVSAAERIKVVANVTPVMTSRTLNNQFSELLRNDSDKKGVEVFLKCENYQRVGAFKFRGAYNALSLLSEEQKKAGVVTFSSGNHAQAIALSSNLLKIPATIIMPLDAPELKVAATRGYGAEIVMYDRYKEDREQIAETMRQKNPLLTIIPPYNHPAVVAGQGTSCLELMNDERIRGDKLTHLFVCLGGGGLLAGCCLVSKQLAPNCKIYGVEPDTGNDGQQSLEKGCIVSLDTAPKTIADGAQTLSLGTWTYPIIKRDCEKIITVTDDELKSEMKFLAERMKMIVEPTGCLGVAGVRKALKEGVKGCGIDIGPGSRIGILISGGNVDLVSFSQFIQ